MIAAGVSERDRAILRTFARRIDASDAGAHNNLGVLYFKKGMIEESVAALTRALEIDPKMSVAQRNLEVAYLNTGYFDTRVAALTERLRVDPSERDTRWELARAYALLGQTAEAVAEFTALLRYAPGDLPSLIQLGLAEKARGDLASARHWFDRALQREPNNALVHHYVGEVLYNMGLSDDAELSLTRSLELNPEQPDALYLLAFVLGDLGRHEEAQAVTKRAIALNPSLSRAQANLSLDQYNPQRYEELLPGRRDLQSAQRAADAEGAGLAHYALGAAFRQKGYFAEALREYRLAAEKGEPNELVQQAMAEVLLLQQDAPAAIAIYDQLLRSQPHAAKLWNERGVALHQTGDVAGAEASYRRAISADPVYAFSHNNIGVVRVQGGDREGAIDAFRAALDARPDLEQALLNLALQLFRERRFEESMDAYRRVLRSVPEQAVAWNGVGLILAESRQFEEARNAYARAIQARPQFAEAHYNLSFTLSNLGDFEGALRETQRALELEPYYVPQKFVLAIDLEFDASAVTIAPELSSDERRSGEVREFAFDAGSLDEIFGTLSTAPAAEPELPSDGRSPFALASDYFHSGMLDRAAAEARRVIQRGVESPEGALLLGDIYARQGAWGEALGQYSAGLRLAPGTPALLRGAATALITLGRGSEARPIAEELAAVLPDDVDAWMVLASARFDAGDAVAAVDALNTAKRLAPTRADVHRRLGDIARAQGDRERAVVAYRAALSLDPDFAAVRLAVAQLLLEEGDLGAAERELLAALDAVPTFTDAVLLLGRVYRDSGRPEPALTILVELLQRDLSNVAALHALAETLWVMGRTADAAVAVERILLFDREHAGAWYLTGAIAAARRSFTEAVAAWDRVLELEPSGESARRAARALQSVQELHTVGAD